MAYSLFKNITELFFLAIVYVTQSNINKSLLHEISFDDDDKIFEGKISQFLENYDILIRKYDDTLLSNLGILHYGFISDSEKGEIIQYYGEGQNKNDAQVKRMKLIDFTKSSQINEFYIFRIKKEHLNNDFIIKTIILNREGERKYDILTNNCENLCLDILIKSEYRHLYQTQVEYLIKSMKIINDERLFKEKIKDNLEHFLKQLIPCKFDSLGNTMTVYKNKLEIFYI